MRTKTWKTQQLKDAAIFAASAFWLDVTPRTGIAVVVTGSTKNAIGAAPVIQMKKIVSATHCLLAMFATCAAGVTLQLHRNKNEIAAGDPAKANLTIHTTVSRRMGTIIRQELTQVFSGTSWGSHLEHYL